MIELISVAWSGWQDDMVGGKMIALLPAALLFLWCGRKRREQQGFLVYTIVMTVGCILPITAVLLMRYQTGFYDYIDVWSLVPVTAVIAYGGAAFLTEGWEDGRQWRSNALPGLALLLAAAVFCGMPGAKNRSLKAEDDQRRHAYEVVEQLEELYRNEDFPSETDRAICLWAPREIMEYAREADASILLPYGRNMWDLPLSGYTYDSYGACQVELNRLMEQDPEEWSVDMVKNELPLLVREAGVSCILLPAGLDPDVVEAAEEAWECQVRPVEEYLVIWIH